MLRLVDDAVAAWTDDPGCGFAVGTFGAIAEFLRPPGADVTVGHRGGVHTVSCADGAIRVDLRGVDDLVTRAWRRPTGTDAWTQAVALCLPVDRAAGPGRDVVTVLGEDPDPVLTATDADPGVLVDLGLGVAHLEACIRTVDAELLARCRSRAGEPLDGPLTAAIVAAGATRVFRTVLARAEVATPIPLPDGTSPMGPHTHLLPDLLARRRTHAATDPIPDGEVPVVSIFPPHPARDALGRERAWDAAADARFEADMERFGDPEELAATRAARAGEPEPDRAVVSAATRRGATVGARWPAPAEP